jgi:hypothetical protein
MLYGVDMRVQAACPPRSVDQNRRELSLGSLTNRHVT